MYHFVHLQFSSFFRLPVIDFLVQLNSFAHRFDAFTCSQSSCMPLTILEEKIGRKLTCEVFMGMGSEGKSPNSPVLTNTKVFPCKTLRHEYHESHCSNITVDVFISLFQFWHEMRSFDFADQSLVMKQKKWYCCLWIPENSPLVEITGGNLPDGNYPEQFSRIKEKCSAYPSFLSFLDQFVDKFNLFCRHQLSLCPTNICLEKEKHIQC